MEKFFKFDNQILESAFEAENECKKIFEKIDEIESYNQRKVLSAFIKNKVASTDLLGSTGYGYGDKGREKLERVFSDIFFAEDALVRHNFVCGTHAISVALFALLRPGKKLISVTGTPYDTLKEVIGIKGKENQGSLKNFGILYDQIDLNKDGSVNLENIAKKCKEADVIYIQRSKGYSLRPSLTIEKIKEVINLVKNLKKNVKVIVDNCYGEFVDKQEPIEVGADLIIGSLIKNPGGGIAKTGGYIVGKADLIELCGDSLTAPGIGKEVGCTFDEMRNMFLGLFMSPQATSNALKTAVFASKLFEKMGYEVYPYFDEKRTDIIQAIKLKSKQEVIAFCKGIQKCSPIDSFVSPIPWKMPGYVDEVVMASGSFTMGSSIELSADAPIRAPFAIWVQGGLTYHVGKIGIISALQEIKNILN